MHQNSGNTFSKLSSALQKVPLKNPAQFARVSEHPKFSVTPDCMNLCSGTSTRGPQPQCETPSIEMKSYNQRVKKSSLSILGNGEKDSNTSFYAFETNAPITSCSSSRTDNIKSNNSKKDLMEQRVSPNSSPKLLDHWSFKPMTNNKCSLQNLMPDNRNVMYIHSNVPSSPQNDSTLTHCVHLQNRTSLAEMPMFCNKHHLQSFKLGLVGCANDSAKLNFNVINDLYVKRIDNIDSQAWGDKDLKIVTYKEWIKVLRKINESYINNMEDLEREVAGHLELMQKRGNSNCRYSQDHEIIKYRKDINTLLKYISNISNHKHWDRELRALTFETITPDQILNICDSDILTRDDNAGNEMKLYNDHDDMQKNKLYSDMRALAQEVAEKHDEVIELKRQVICLEDEIQKAQKKIQLKDDVIKELRNDLKGAKNKISNMASQDTKLAMPPINFDNQSSRSTNTQITGTSMLQVDDGSQFDSLSCTEVEEQEKIKILQEELCSFFEMNHDLNKQKMENQLQKVMDFINKTEVEKNSAYRKIEFIRSQLINLESGSLESNSDSGVYSKSGNDEVAKLLDAVRKRFRKLIETNCELKDKSQNLELEKNELTNNLQVEKVISERSNDLLKQVADLLSVLTGKKILYARNYKTSVQKLNPFCEAVIEMYKDFLEEESKLIKTIESKNKKHKELCELLLKNEKDFIVDIAVRQNANDFENIKNTSAAPLFSASQSLPTTISKGTVTLQDTSTLPTSLVGQQSAEQRE